MSHCQDIAEIISGYRKKDRNSQALNLKINEAHVERWINQFQQNQDIILLETKKLLEKFYFSKDDISTFLNSVCTAKSIWGNDPEGAISDACFLNCQTKGESQRRLWKKIGKIVEDEYGLLIPKQVEYSSCSTFIYVDDCMFSGNTLLKDMQSLLQKIPAGSRVYAVFIMKYSFANWWVHKILDPQFEERGVELKILSCCTMQNSGGGNYSFDCLRPKEYESALLDEYLEVLEKEHEATPDKKVNLFRTASSPGGVFDSEKNRNVLEQELMEAGLKIRSFTRDPKQFMRPMGYDNRISFGFGGFFATYMNMSNNCPLAYWWGDPSADDWHPLSKWYPLLPRKVNGDEGVNAW